MASFVSSIMKNIVACCSRFLVKLICCISFGPASSAYCLLKSISIILQYHFTLRNRLLDLLQLFECSTFRTFRIIICSNISFNWLIKNVFSINHNIVFFYFYFWQIISCVYFSALLFLFFGR